VKKNEADSFRGLLYNPTLEHEVVILFSLLIPYLRESYVIDEYPDTFPDCFALRDGQRVGIEFEVLASYFYDHKHDKDVNLTKCNIIVCWKNDIRNTTKRNDTELLNVKGHEIEIIALDRMLEKNKSLKFILNGERPDVYRVGEEIFFEQLKETGHKKCEWIKGLYDQLKQSEDFKVKWGGGERWSTMRFCVKKWDDINPISVYGNGSVEIAYQGNKAIFPWFELPQETKTELRQIFKNPKQKWYHVPLNNETDLANINKALRILAEHSKRFNIIWHTKD
jgi:hypothetical protein